MSDLSRANSKTIGAAFKRLLKSERSSIGSALPKMLDDCVKEALDLHDARHQRHIDLGDNYGWVAVHDGKEIGRKVKAEAGKSTAEAGAILDRLSSGADGQGWTGYVMAGMKGYYNLDYEIGILNDVASDVPSILKNRLRSEMK